MQLHLFGTDGCRGVANAELSPELAFRLGRAGGYFLSKQWDGHEARPRVVVGRDTRLSGDMLEAALVAGVTSVGVDVVRAGVLPTPALAFVARALGAAGAAMVSASHNPVEDNGIKFFSAGGYKLAVEEEAQIESLVLAGEDRLPRPTGGGVGRAYDRPDALDLYVKHVTGLVDSLAGYRLVADVAHGAAYHVAPLVLRRLGAHVTVMNGEPDGHRINVRCGSTHPEALQEAVLREKADVGLAFDGDADRLIAVSSSGRVVDGDVVMGICALDALARGELPGRAIAATVMSNYGLDQALERLGGAVVRTAVGDRNVLHAMLERHLAIGGEQSGHVIFLDANTTGDGIITALKLLGVMRRTGRSLDELAGQVPRWPQVQQSVRVARKAGWDENPRIRSAMEEVRQRLGEMGRVLVRPSGTEPVIRVMIEGSLPQAELHDMVRALAGVIESELNQA